MNAIRIKCRNGDPDSLLIQSTLDKSHRLNAKTDEVCQFDQNSLVILKSLREDGTHALEFAVTAVDEPSHAIVFRSTRRSTFVLRNGFSAKIFMQAGEVLQIRNEHARNSAGVAPEGVMP